MASDSSKVSHNITSLEHQRSLPASSCIPWLIALSTECLAIVIFNIIAIIVFVKQPQLQRRSKYLIIHLAIVDLLVGAVSGPMQIHLRMALCYGELESYDITYLRINLAIRPFFPFASLVNLTFISLERAHATYRPFKHRFIKKWVYGIFIALIHLSTVCKGAIEGFTDWPFNYIWVGSSYFSLLVLICVSYISIAIKVHCSRRPQHHCAAGLRERKLTSTLFFATCASLLTFVPVVIYESMIMYHIIAIPKFTLHFQISNTTLLLFLANSLINPISYAVRMPHVRAGISKVVFCKTPDNRINPLE
ncbi:uncharacterized protein LOC111347657 [Stylophora pistillata]|uniref:uncharacterized protein LOC111347657 n=1 Tax=Stylophora pistillata TaxID=50429 RepID=UPI000C05494E|nr:uncharacterized protein LOC111347657 [Stylophora pistillata]